MWFGMDIVTSGVQEQVAGTPAMQEHIGDIQSFSVNFVETGEAANEYGDDDVLAFDVKGSKGSGQVIVKTSPGPDGSPNVVWAKLRTGGEEFDIVGGEEEFEFE